MSEQDDATNQQIEYLRDQLNAALRDAVTQQAPHCTHATTRACFMVALYHAALQMLAETTASLEVIYGQDDIREVAQDQLQQAHNIATEEARKQAVHLAQGSGSQH